MVAAIAIISLVTIRPCSAQQAPVGQQAPAGQQAPGAKEVPAPTRDKSWTDSQRAMEHLRQRMQVKIGQPAKPAQAAEPTLEEMLTNALKDNPDIRVAEAKVREAEAELNRTRLQVTQKVLAFRFSRESQKAVIKFAEENMQRMQKLKQTNAISQEDFKVAEQNLAAAKAKLAEIEAEMPYLLGQHRIPVFTLLPSADGKTFVVHKKDASPLDIATHLRFDVVNVEPETVINSSNQERTTIADKVRKALETQVTVDYRQKQLGEILDDLKKKAPGLSIHDLSGISGQVLDLKIDGQVPLRTALELLEDTCSVLQRQTFEGGAVGAALRVSFVLRDYGLLFAPNESLPPGAVHISNLGPAVQPAKPKEKPAEKNETGQPEKKP
jgi:hypothetical protein